MGKNNFFQFKQFRVVQEKSAMKVGIDGVLLGAWARFSGEKLILDIGTGTGLLALMAAQRTSARIDAVEIDQEAAEEAQFNFRNSIWSDRLAIHGTSFQDFNANVRYDHIISNPPFFDHSQKPNDQKRSKARHSDSLNMSELLTKSQTLLKRDGKISLILPADKEGRLQILLTQLGFFISRIAYVASDKNKKPHRILVELSNSQDITASETIFLYQDGLKEYSYQYRELTRDFYLSH